MHTLGVSLASVEAGRVILRMPFAQPFTQQHGFLHAGIVTALVDSACGWAALSLMPEGKEVLSVEFKVNLLRPARGDHFEAIGEVVKSGRTLTVCSGRLVAFEGERETIVAQMQATMIGVEREQERLKENT